MGNYFDHSFVLFKILKKSMCLCISDIKSLEKNKSTSDKIHSSLYKFSSISFICLCLSLYLYIIAQSCLTLCNPMDCSLTSSSVHGIFQARILEWVAIYFSKRSSQTRDWTRVSCIVDRWFTIWATREVLLYTKRWWLRCSQSFQLSN